MSANSTRAVPATQQPAPASAEHLGEVLISEFFDLVENEEDFASKYREDVLRMFRTRGELNGSEEMKAAFFKEFKDRDAAKLRREKPTALEAIRKFKAFQKANQALPLEDRIRWEDDEELEKGYREYRNQENRKYKQWGRFVELLHPKAKEAERLKLLREEKRRRILVSFFIS